MLLKEKSKIKKLVSVLATSTQVIIVKKEEIENAEDSKNLKTTAEVGKNSENLKINLIWVPYI